MKSICAKTSQKLVTKIIKNPQKLGHAVCSYSETRLDSALDPNRMSALWQFYVSTSRSSVSLPMLRKQQVMQSTVCKHFWGVWEFTFQVKMERKLNVLWLSSMVAVMDYWSTSWCSSIDNLWLWVHDVCLHALHPSTYLSCCHCHPGHANVWPGIAATNVCKSSHRHETKRTTHESCVLVAKKMHTLCLVDTYQYTVKWL